MFHPSHLQAPQQPQTGNPISRELGFIIWLLNFPALSVLPFIRRDIGYRVLSPTTYGVMALIIFMMPDIIGLLSADVSRQVNTASHGVLQSHGIRVPPSIMLQAYAVLMLLLALYKRNQAWIAFVKGKGWHSYSPGVSYLSLPSINTTKIRRDIIHRFIDPAWLLIMGIPVLFFNVWELYGWWLTISGISLILYEQRYHEWLLSGQWDRHDLSLLPNMQNKLIEDIKESQERWEEESKETGRQAASGIIAVLTKAFPKDGMRETLLKARQQPAEKTPTKTPLARE